MLEHEGISSRFVFAPLLHIAQMPFSSPPFAFPRATSSWFRNEGRNAHVGFSWLRPRRAMDRSNRQEWNIHNGKVPILWPAAKPIPNGVTVLLNAHAFHDEWHSRVEIGGFSLATSTAPPESDATSYTAGKWASNTAGSLHCRTVRDTAYLRDLPGSLETC